MIVYLNKSEQNIKGGGRNTNGKEMFITNVTEMSQRIVTREEIHFHSNMIKKRGFVVREHFFLFGNKLVWIDFTCTD